MKSKVSFKKEQDLNVRNIQKELDNIYALLSRLEKKAGTIGYGENYIGNTAAVDETDTNSVKNKTVSNLLAYGWETNKHSQLHAIDSTNDHSSSIVEDDIMTADSNGLPKDSGTKISDLSAAWVSPPTLPTDPGIEHEMAEDGSYLYICIATDTWRRTALSSWPTTPTGSAGLLIGLGMFTYSS